MASADSEAIEALTTALTALIPGGVPAPLVAIHPRCVRPAGLGGFIGLHHDPAGDIVGRRIDATLSVTVVADDPASLTAAITAVNRALVAADPTALRTSGVLKLALDDIGPQTAAGDGGGLRQALSFTVLYEYLKPPEEAAGIIEEITLDVTTK
jgi:hypothetical protein